MPIYFGLKPTMNTCRSRKFFCIEFMVVALAHQYVIAVSAH